MNLLIPLIIGGAVLGLIALSLLIAMALRRVVPTNMVHIVQSKSSTTSYGKGREAGNVYYEWPAFLPFLGVTLTEFPESVFDVGLKGYEAFDKGRLPFVVDIMAFFRIKDSNVAAHRVANFVELQTQLQSILMGAVRSVLAEAELESIMQDRTTLGDRFTTAVDGQLAEWGVQTVKSIEFMDIRDKTGEEVIHQIMAKEKSRIDRESREAVAENNRSAQEREIEAQRQIELARQQAGEQVGQRTAESDKNVGLARETAKQEVLLASRLTIERDMEVNRIREVKTAEISRDVAAVKAEQDKQVAVVDAEAKRDTEVISATAAKQAEVISAEAEKQRTELIAQGKLAAAKNEAEGIRATGEAKAKAEEAILLAPVTAQITLAQEIGSNPAYQSYLVEVRRVEATQAVGIEMAGAMKTAEMKIIANAGDVQGGIGKLADIFTPTGGTSIAGMLTALAQTDEGKAVVEKISTPKPKTTK